MNTLSYQGCRTKEPAPLILLKNKKTAKCLPHSAFFLNFAPMNRKKKRKDRFANWLLDIAKYITTAVILSSIFQGIEDKKYLLITGVAVVGASLGWGMLLIQDDDVPAKKKKG